MKPFVIFPVIRHLSEVCALSGCGKVRTAIRIITTRLSLPPTSFTRISFGTPYGSLPLCGGEIRAYHVPHDLTMTT
ncbi:hypothetical protein [Desulfonema magnum]|uniref:hypothetical protein n=1 Tax=Desulfonema magnum TaxID=45655 RepID=UPI001A9C1B11|nr:hypothetical protein [Desulfonema magnum]